MRKKKPYKILEEYQKRNHIVIQIFKRRNTFTYDIMTFIGDGGFARPEEGPFKSFFGAKNAALHYIIASFKSPPQKTLLRKFRLMEDVDQPLLFDE
jgi:hypothetical protein